MELCLHTGTEGKGVLIEVPLPLEKRNPQEVVFFFHVKQGTSAVKEKLQRHAIRT